MIITRLILVFILGLIVETIMITACVWLLRMVTAAIKDRSTSITGLCLLFLVLCLAVSMAFDVAHSLWRMIP